MAHLVRRSRHNPAAGRKETYFLLQERGKPALSLGFVDERTAKDALKVYQAELVQEAQGHVRPTMSPVSSAGPVIPTIAEWWGGGDLRFAVETPSPMHKWALAEGKKGDGLRVLNDSRKVLLADPISGLRLNEVTPRVGDELIGRLRACGLRSRTIQIRVGHLQKSLKVAEDYGVLTLAPKLRVPKNTDKKPHVWHTPEQSKLLILELRRRAQPMFGLGGRPALIDAVTLLAICADVSLGLRKSELLTRRWPDLDWSAALLKIDDQRMPDGDVWRPKTAESYRSVSVPDALLDMFREEWLRQGRPNGWIFPSDGSDWPRGDFRKALANACKAAGLPVLHPHALRHTWATAWLWSGAAMPDLVAEGGWASATVPTEIYVHTAGDRRKAFAEAASPLRSTSEGSNPADGTGRKRSRSGS